MESMVELLKRLMPSSGISTRAVLVAALIAIAFSTPYNQLASAQKESSPRASSKSQDVYGSGIDELFSFVSEKDPGAVVTVSRNGLVLLRKYYGKADCKSQTPFNAHTLFDLASCSKQFTAIALLKLVEKGKLKLDDDISIYFPELRKKDGKKLTVRHLAGMTSGLSDYSEGMSKKDQCTKNNADVLAWTAKQARRFPPGQKYEYNNGNYAILALLIEKVSKMSYPQFMKKEIFEPLGMTETFVMDKPGMSIPNRAVGYKSTKKGFVPSRADTFIYGDGQIMTSARDFSFWDRALYEKRFLRPDLFGQAILSGELNNKKPSGYGMGFVTETLEGHPVIEHEGSWDGTNTFILRFLDSNIAVMVLSNNENLNAGELGTKLAQLFVPKSATQNRDKAAKHS